MSSMTKTERFRAALAGADLDHLPVSVWLHFATEHLPGDAVADRHLAYLGAYDFDYLKVMNDYRWPLPQGVANIQTADDLRRIEPLAMTVYQFDQQLRCLRKLRRELPDTPLIETLFNPLQTLVRGAGQSAAQTVLANPEAGDEALQAITDTLVAYVRALQAEGIDGLFYSINGAVDPAHGGLTDEQFARFVTPYDQRILEAAQGMARVCHVHGFHLRFDRCVSYPVEAFNWSHFNTAPSLAEARRLTDAALIGGINEVMTTRQSATELESDIRASVAEAGWHKFLVGPGCTTPPDSPDRLLRAAVATAHGLALV